MRVLPIESMIHFGSRKNKKEDDGSSTEQKDISVKDINPSFKYYMTTCQPIKNPIVFKGAWPEKRLNNSPIFDTNGMIFPLTVVPNPDGDKKPGQLNYFA